MKRLENKTALVTGGNSGIGYATAKEFLAQGAEVIITGRNRSKLDEALISLGSGSQGVLSDASEMKDISSLPKKIKDLTQKLDILFLNAGSYEIAPFELNKEDYYDSMQQLYSKGVFFTIQQLLPIIPSGGSIVINNTIAVNRTIPGYSSLIAAKGAAMALSRALANELAAKNIRVNTISPGAIIDTPGAMKTIAMALGVSEPSPEQIQMFAENIIPGIPAKRFGKAHEVAKAVLFLASDESSYVTGTNLVVDGGKSIAMV
jgi:NAD(P)-dependent dehydrogenase (short-subunit alcohol dehydrogenase family)